MLLKNFFMALAKLFPICFGSFVSIDVISTWAMQNLNLNIAIIEIINNTICVIQIETI